MGFGEAPAVTKAGLVVAIVAFIVNIIGFAAPYWFKGIFGNHSGLWMICPVIGDCQTIEEAYGEYEATRTFEAIGFLASLASIFFLILYTCVSKTSGNRIVAILTAASLFGASACILIGVITYASGVVTDTDRLSWAFALSCVGGVLFGVSGLLIIISICARK